MSNELAVLNNQAQIQQGGLGVDFNNPLFRLKPATLNIVQSNSTVGTKGNLRISETGDEFEEMFVTLLTMPQEARSYYIGEPGQLNRTPDNLMCFSRDLIQPDEKSKIPQAMRCASCSRQDWGPWRDAKAKGVSGQNLKNLIPPCDAYFYTVMLDTVYRMPLQMFVRSKSKDAFAQGMQNVARTLAISKAQGKNPNLFDVRFRLSTKQITTGNFKSYVLNISDVKYISDEERAAFGEIYLQYIAGKQKLEENNAIAEAEAEVAASNESINESVVSGPVEGEYLKDEVITI